jgi:hypothetical protein
MRHGDACSESDRVAFILSSTEIVTVSTEVD